MLARALPGVPVLVGADRYLPAALAEQQLGATVHLLDDGFQHLQLARDVDLLLVDRRRSAATACCRPAGCASRSTPPRPPTRCSSTAGDAAAAERIGRRSACRPSFRVPRSARRAAHGCATGDPASCRERAGVRGRRHRAAASASSPTSTSAGWRVGGTLAFRDHHRFTPRDVDAHRARGARRGRGVVLTTEKDAVRLDGRLSADLPLRRAAAARRSTVEPADAFAIVAAGAGADSRDRSG